MCQKDLICWWGFIWCLVNDEGFRSTQLAQNDVVFFYWATSESDGEPGKHSTFQPPLRLEFRQVFLWFVYNFQ